MTRCRVFFPRLRGQRSPIGLFSGVAKSRKIASRGVPVGTMTTEHVFPIALIVLGGVARSVSLLRVSRTQLALFIPKRLEGYYSCVTVTPLRGAGEIIPFLLLYYL